MGDASYGNAMTEIALALAMGFFAIMVLAMVSMGAPATTPAAAPVKLTLAPPALKANQASTHDDKKTIVVFWNGAFLDKDLKPIDIETRAFPDGVILALSPRLSMAEALKARARLRTTKLVVSTLDARWLDTLSKTLDKEHAR